VKSAVCEGAARRRGLVGEPWFPPREKVEVHEVDADVNDPAFALAMANRRHELIEAAR
jgi:hypothetical protein